MSISDEELMAYADGELDGAQFVSRRAALEAALQADPELARRVAEHRQLREQLGTLHAEALEEPVPERLLTAARAVSAALPSATVTDLAAVRAARAAAARPGRRVPVWSALAASVLIAAGVGYFAFLQHGGNPLALKNGELVARAALDRALNQQLAGTAPIGAVAQMGVSFRAKTGAYCRSFVLKQAHPVAGLACHQGPDWIIKALAPSLSAPSSADTYRLAASELPPTVRSKIEELIAGDPLDAAAEAQARQAQWR
jgi:anti-sigma factor RsiW